jgi:PAS domain S-box-containing protein
VDQPATAVGRTIIESALRDSEQRYTVLFNAAPGPMWVFDVESLQVLAVNDAALAQYGYTRDEFLALTLRDLRPSGDIGPFWRAHVAMRAGNDVHGVYRHKHRDGRLLDVEVRTSTLPIGEGRLRIALATDITPHKQSADAARFLDKATGILMGTLEPASICRNLASLATPMLGDWCVVHRLTAAEQLTVCGYAHANPLEQELLTEVVQRRPAVGGDHPVMRAWRTGLTVEPLEDIARAVWGGAPEGANALLVQALGAVTALYVPIIAQGRPLGVLECVGTGVATPPAESLRALAEALADRVGMALTNALVVEEARVTLRAKAPRGILPPQSTVPDAMRWVVESIPDCFLNLDSDWTLTYVNGEAERLLQRPREELLGRNYWQIFPETVGTSFERAYRRAMLERRAVAVDDYYAAFDTWFEVRAQPSGTGLALFFRDVSAQHRDLQRLEQSEAQFRDFLESSTDLIHMTRSDGRLLYANRVWRETLGYTEEETHRLPIIDFVAPESRETARAALAQCVRGGETAETELVVLAKDGRRLVVRGRSTCRYVDGVAVSTRAVYRDVTAEVETQKLLRQAERTDAMATRGRTAFLDRISHELRTPLTAVIGFAGILERNRRQDMSPADLDFVHRIGVQGRHLLALIEDLLEYADIESHRVDLDVADVDIRGLVQEIVADYAPEARSFGVSLRLALPEEPAMRDTDAATLRRIVRYLVTDAVRRGTGGEVEVRLAAGGRSRRPTAIVITDLPRPDGDAAAQASRSRDSGVALELGLTVARTLAQVLGDDLVIEPRADGGVTRRLYLHDVAPPSRRQSDETAVTLHAFVEASPLAIVAFESDWTVRLWNEAAARLYGWSVADVVERRLPIVRAENGAAFRELLRTALAAPRGLTDVPAVHARRDGSNVDVLMSVAPLRGPDGRVSGFVCIVADVTERHRLEEELRQAHKMEVVGRLAGGIAHDFNNLLTVISAHASFLLADLEPTGVPADDARAIQEATGRAAALTRQLLVFAHKQVPQRRVVDLNRKVENVGRMLRRTLGSHIEFATVLSPEPACVFADPAQMEQVLMNLILNARDAMPEGGALVTQIGVSEEGADAVARGVVPAAGKYAVITVSDTGIGMDDATRRRIFEPFFTTKSAERGTGIGLATVHAIVTDARGGIEVESTPGVGTTFRVRLPFVDPIAGHTAEYFFGDPGARGNETVLVVEDQDAVRAVAARVLGAYGYTVLQARHGNDALATLRATPGRIDLLLTDLVMPEMHGQELADRVRQIEPTVRVLFMSGYVETPRVPSERDASTPIVRKPFSGEELAHAVREALDSA